MALRARIASCFLVGAVLTAAPLCASAQGLSATDEANARFQTGLKYYDNHDFESARLAFKQAYAVLQKPSILLNLALSELYSNHPLDAIQHFEEYIRDPSTPGDKRDKAKKHLEDAMKKTSHLQIRTATDAQLTLDGAPVAPPYTTVHVMPGTHALEARLKDKTKSASVNTKAGDTLAVDLQFEGEPSAPPVVEPPPNASQPPTSAGTGTPIEPPPRPTTTESFWGLRSVGGIVLIGVGAAAIVGGVVFRGEESDQRARADELRSALPLDACSNGADPRCSALADAIDSRDAAATRATIFLIAGAGAAVVGVAGVVSALVWPHRNAVSSVGVRPIIQHSLMGLWATATF